MFKYYCYFPFVFGQGEGVDGVVVQVRWRVLWIVIVIVILFVVGWVVFADQLLNKWLVAVQYFLTRVITNKTQFDNDEHPIL